MRRPQTHSTLRTEINSMWLGFGRQASNRKLMGELSKKPTQSDVRFVFWEGYSVFSVDSGLEGTRLKTE